MYTVQVSPRFLRSLVIQNIFANSVYTVANMTTKIRDKNETLNIFITKISWLCCKTFYIMLGCARNNIPCFHKCNNSAAIK
jgi:hypothetical protein